MIRIPLVLFAFFLASILPAEGAPIGGEVPQKVEDRFLPEGDGVKVEEWVENLEIPWSLLFLPGDRALVSERPGRIRLIKGGKLRGDPYATLNVAHVGEGGLMGLAFTLNFKRNPIFMPWSLTGKRVISLIGWCDLSIWETMESLTR
jgi:glucose/arabinose dehydrogenase